MNSSISKPFSRSVHLLGSLASALSLSRTGRWLRRQIWLWPMIAAVGLSVLGYWTYHAVIDTMDHQVAANLRSTRQAQVAALEIWFDAKQTDAAAMAADPQVQSVVASLAALPPEQTTAEALLNQPKVHELRAILAPAMKAQGYHNLLLANQHALIVAATRPELLGRQVKTPAMLKALAKVFSGKRTVTRPYKSIVTLKDEQGQEHAGLPTMFVLAPVSGPDGKINAALGFRIDPKDRTRILSVAQGGNSDESYVFDRDGVMLSGSRFDESLKQIGLLTDNADAHSILQLDVRDPGVDMTTGARPALRRRDQSLTRLAQAAIAGETGIDVTGYRDYRGMRIVGAWTWLDDYGMGLAVEMDHAEAYGGLEIIRWVFWGLIALLVAGAVAIQVVMIYLARTHQALREAALQAKQLGQYTLEDKLGAGGMGVVYKARHALLRRPTAVKLLDVNKTSPDAIARFQREVQLTSQLNHPNTIAIYDFGHTPEGIFFYAMEYLDGPPLDKLVEHYGPLPEGRVIHILMQMCGSLAEAHDLGLVHRDIKPANLVLNRRGGLCDVVKVLDFGLVKALDQEKEAGITSAGTITGTPQYMSPEAIENPDTVDSRSDLYAVGAVGYFLLTGTPVFSGRSLIELCRKQVHERPEPLSQRLGKPVSADLEALLLRCLAKKKEDRPGGARILAAELSALAEAATWTQHQAEEWWESRLAPPATLIVPKPAGPETVALSRTEHS